MKEIIIDTLIDGLKLIPFLFVAFLIIELIEHKLSNKNKELRFNVYSDIVNSFSFENYNNEVIKILKKDTTNLDKFNIGSTDKVLSDSALYAVWYFITNDFTGGIIRNNTSKTEYKVTKNGVTDIFTLTATNQSPTKCDIKKYMELFNKSFNMKCELEQLKAQLRK